MSEKIWKGLKKYYKISEMETSHIKNCIKYIKRSGNREEFLEDFEKELEKRNLCLTGDIKEDKITITEQIYFLETSCGYNIIKSKDLNELLQTLLINDKIKNFFDKNLKLTQWIQENNIVVIQKKLNKEETIELLRSDIISLSKTNDFNNFYKKWETSLLINVFEKEWKPFIDMLLGRYIHE